MYNEIRTGRLVVVYSSSMETSGRSSDLRYVYGLGFGLVGGGGGLEPHTVKNLTGVVRNVTRDRGLAGSGGN